MRNIIISIGLLTAVQAYATSFQEIISLIDKHDIVYSKLNLSNSVKEQATVKSSWGDPMLTIGAMNFPEDSLAHNESMMTSYQFGLSQKVSLSGKYSKLKGAGLEKSKSIKSDSEQEKRKIAKFVWEVGIEKKRLIEEDKILKENLTWITNMLKISKRLYETGKAPQQAVLDVHIRKSELKTSLDKLRFSKESLDLRLSEVLSIEKKHSLELSTIPWSYLDKWRDSSDKFDYKEKSLKHKLRSSELMVTAKNRNFIPDLKLGVSYTKRNDLDGVGDFVGASIGFTLPIGSSKYAQKSAAVYERVSNNYSYQSYKKTKDIELSRLEIAINDLDNELSILKSETLKFAKSSRDVTAKSYSTGTTDYVELLRSELQYQKQLIKKVRVESVLKNKKLSYLFLKGDDLMIRSLK